MHVELESCMELEVIRAELEFVKKIGGQSRVRANLFPSFD